jgi:hypothetical protein
MAVGKVVATVVAATATIMTAFTTIGATTNTRVAKSLGGNGGNGKRNSHARNRGRGG